MRLVFVLHDPEMAAELLEARPGTPVATYGGPPQRQLLGAASHLVLVPAEGDLTTLRLLEHPEVGQMVGAEPSLIVCFKPSTRVERAAEVLGARIALTSAPLARGLENKLLLPELAQEAGVRIPRQQRIDVRADTPWSTLVNAVGEDAVVQSPRGFSGKKTFRVRDAETWEGLRVELARRPAKVAEYVSGRPGTLHAVVDAEGHVVVSAPIVQVTGEPSLTPFPMGSCGNDFRWRPTPYPRDAEALAEAMGPVISARGYLGAFGLDYVVAEDGACVLIEINPRLTASFALYASRCPRLLDDHLTALDGGALVPTRLPAFDGGQLVRYKRADSPQGRLITRGPVVDEAGAIVLRW